jgi:hypothetical protein
MRRLLFLVGAIVLVDTMFFTALTPLLPHYVDKLDLGKGGAGLLQAMYPLGALLAAVPGGIAAARFGVKPTVMTGVPRVFERRLEPVAHKRRVVRDNHRLGCNGRGFGGGGAHAVNIGFTVRPP